MKLYAIITSFLLLILAACSTSYHTASRVDDIYYTPEVVRPAGSNTTYADAKVVEVPQEASRPSDNNYQQNNNQAYPYAENESDYQTPHSSEYYASDEGNVFVSNYFYGDVYDYAYSSRLRRFYSPMAYAGYYDPFYTNMYWYNFNPYYSGVSIYMGYGAMPFYYPGYYWNPFYSYRMSYGYGFGWSHSPFGYGYWNSPYSFYSPYSFMSAYHYGFSSGYYLGHYDHPYYYQYLYNSYDRSNYHYGPRQGGGSSTRIHEGRSTAGSIGSAGTFAERFEGSTVKNANGMRETIPVSDRAPGRAGTRADAPVKAGEEIPSRPQRAGLPASQTVSQPRAGESPTGRSGEQGRTTDEQTDRPTRGTVTPEDVPSATRPQARPDAGTATRPQTRPDAGTATRPQIPSETGTQVRPQSGTERPQTPPQRYSRPEQMNPSTQQGDNQPAYNTPPRTYTSPSYQQPRSNEQYRNPQTARPPAVAPPREALPAARDNAQPDRQQAQPQTRPAPQQTRPQTRPAQQQTRPQAQPAARPASTPSSRPSAAPSAPRSTPSASPARSSGSSSAAPARSSGSSSAPARSSGGSSSGRRP